MNFLAETLLDRELTLAWFARAVTRRREKRMNQTDG